MDVKANSVPEYKRSGVKFTPLKSANGKKNVLSLNFLYFTRAVPTDLRSCYKVPKVGRHNSTELSCGGYAVNMVTGGAFQQSVARKVVVLCHAWWA